MKNDLAINPVFVIPKNTVSDQRQLTFSTHQLQHPAFVYIIKCHITYIFIIIPPNFFFFFLDKYETSIPFFKNTK